MARRASSATEPTANSTTDRLPRIVHALAGPTPVGAPSLSREATLAAVHRLLSASELGNAPAVDIPALLSTMLPGTSDASPILMPQSEPLASLDMPTVLAWMGSSGQVFQRLATEFGPADLAERAIATRRALDVALRWVRSLADAVRLLDRSLRAQAGPVQSESATELAETLSTLEERRARLEQEAVDHQRILADQRREIQRSRSQLEAANGRVAELERRARITERQLSESLGSRATVGQFLVELFSSPSCPEPALRYLVDACARLDRSVATNIALVTFPLPGRALPSSSSVVGPKPSSSESEPVSLLPEPAPEPGSPSDNDAIDYDAGNVLDEATSDGDTQTTSTLGSRCREAGPSSELPGSKRHRQSPTVSTATGAELDASSRTAKHTSPSASPNRSSPNTSTVSATVSTAEPALATRSSVAAAAALNSLSAPRTVDATPARPAPAPRTVDHTPTSRAISPQLGFQPRTVPQPTGVRLLELPPFPATAGLNQRYARLRVSAAYRTVLPVAARLGLRSSSQFPLTSTDLSFSGAEPMGTLTGVRDTMGGWPMQVDRSNTRGYPAAIVRRTHSERAFESYGPNIAEHYRDLMAQRPWDDMWRDRVTRLYLLDPALLDGACERWLLIVLEFMFAHRQALWERLNWIHMPKPSNLSVGDVIPLARQRDRLAEYLAKAHAGLMHVRPRSWPKAFTPLFNMEPAFWLFTKLHCTWVPTINPADHDNFGDGSTLLYDQLGGLYDDEPARFQFGGGRVHHFIEKFDPRAQRAFALHHAIGASWSLPVPWTDPAYTPRPRDMITLGTPGPDFYRPSSHPTLIGVWSSETGALKELVNLYDPNTRASAPEMTRRLLSAIQTRSTAGTTRQGSGRSATPIVVDDDEEEDGDDGDEADEYSEEDEHDDSNEDEELKDNDA